MMKTCLINKRYLLLCCHIICSDIEQSFLFVGNIFNCKIYVSLGNAVLEAYVYISSLTRVSLSGGSVEEVPPLCSPILLILLPCNGLLPPLGAPMYKRILPTAPA